jgi:hypothetical protein
VNLLALPLLLAVGAMLFVYLMRHGMEPAPVAGS